MAGFITKCKDGWIDYNDSTTSSTPISFTGTPIKLTNDGLGLYTNKVYKPVGISDLWNVSNNQFDFTHLAIGDEIELRVSTEITTTSNNQEFTFYLDMAKGSVSNYHLKDGNYIYKSSGTYGIIFNMKFYIGNEDTKNFPAELMFDSDANATIVVDGFYISIKRR